MSQPFNANLFDPNLTQNVVSATGRNATFRMRTVMASLIQHLHDFMRENLITMDELLAAVDLASSPSIPH
jgi:catechol 1,2-dioxygenase